MNKSSSNATWLRIWIEGLAAIGGFASLLALRTHLLISAGADSAGSFCHISAQFDCEAVIGSEWSIFFGIPLASYGIIFYLALFILALCSGDKRLVSARTSGRIFFLGGLVSSLFSIALFVISEVAIGALCLMCITMYLVNFLILSRSWYLAEPEPISQRVQNGIKSILVSPGLLFGAGSSSPLGWVAAWLVLLIGAPISYFVMFPPFKLTQPPPESPRDRVVIKNVLDGSSFGDYYKGSLEAPIEIVEFADFECPGCRNLHVFLEGFLKEFEGKYRFVFRNFPLDNKCNPTIPREFHKYACSAAMYSRCAGEQGKFWEAQDYLFTAPEFENHDIGANVEALLIENGSKSLGLDSVALKECIRSQRYLPKLRDDITEATRIGLQFTPSIWINGRFVEKISAESLRTIINEELARARR